MFQSALSFYREAGARYTINNIVIVKIERILPMVSPAYDAGISTLLYRNGRITGIPFIKKLLIRLPQTAWFNPVCCFEGTAEGAYIFKATRPRYFTYRFIRVP